MKSDGGYVARWQRALRDDEETTDLDWKVGMALSTYADQYTDPDAKPRPYEAGQHAHPGVIELSRASHVARRYIKPVLENLVKRGYIEQTYQARKGARERDEYRLTMCPGDT